MSKPPILLFDFDGVVITQKALEYAALIHSRKRFYSWRNLDDLRLIDFARLFEESDSKNRLKAIFQAFKSYAPYIPSRWKRIIFFVKFRGFYPRYEQYETIDPNLEKILPILKSAKIPLGIVSNTTKKRLTDFKDKLNLEDFFSVFISRDDSKYRKPNPYPILLALNKLKKEKHVKIMKDEIYFIGDLPSDIQTAKNANINSIAVLSGHGRRKDLENTEPTFILKNLSNLLDLDPIKKFLL
jgi:HAD superfamily hydrolase (TIGR01549 family)